MLNNKDIVDFIASGEGHTIEEAANNFGVSISTIKKRLAQVRDQNNINYNAILAEKLRLAQEKVTLRGNKKGGTIGKRGKTFSDEEAIKLAEAYMKGLTIAKLAEITGIPTSTLWDTIRGIKDPDLQARIDSYIAFNDKIIPEKPYEDIMSWKR